MKILKYPNSKLRRVAEPVLDINDEVRAKIEQMIPLMREDGIGLAAPQVGWNARLFIVNVTGDPNGDWVFINPEIVESGGGTWVFDEGCLSLPGITGKVRRDKEIVVRAQDIDGNEFQIKADGLAARCILHENDHLNGKLFIDRISPARKHAVMKKLRKLQKKHDVSASKATA